ncbi:MAG TPA: thioredoxin family protein [Polyangiaceae bacterium]|jgi:thiol:disulfide interchange protein
MRGAALALSGVLALAAGACDNKAPSDVGPDPGARAAPAAPAGKMRVTPAPATGDVQDLVRDALARATTERRRVVVYVGATWCEPCKRFHHAAEAGELDATFPDVTLLEFDLDRDNERLALAGYVSRLIPLFALPATDGRASGQQVEGGIKGDGAVAYMAPRLKSLLAQ